MVDLLSEARREDNWAELPEVFVAIDDDVGCQHRCPVAGIGAMQGKGEISVNLTTQSAFQASRKLGFFRHRRCPGGIGPFGDGRIS